VRQTRQSIKTQKSKLEKTTLGELDVFSQLKDQLKAQEETAAAEQKAAKKKEEEKPKEEVVEEVKEEVVEEVTEEVVEEVVEEVTEEVVEEITEEIVEEVVEVEEEMTEVVEEVTEVKTDAKPDDLKKIEGIGPKIAQLLNDSGISTFEGLASAEVDRLKEILEAAGSRYKMHDPTTWPKQSRLAADGAWDALSTLQDELKGGK